MELFFKRSKHVKSNSCGSLTSNSSGSSTPSPLDKPKSPKFMSRLMEHNPLHRAHSAAPSPAASEEEVKSRTADIAKKIRRKVNPPSVTVTDGTDRPPEKKNKKMLRKLITSVYQDRVPDKPASAAASKGPVFGVPLETAVHRSRVNDHLPLCRVFQDSVMFIETFALTREGIYRVPGFRAKLNEIKQQYNKGDVVKLTNYDPETVGMLLKLWLRELPEPLLTRQLGAQFEGVLQYEDTEQRTAILCAMLRQLPPEHYATLAWLCLHINHVSSHEKINKMTLSNLIIILSPTLLISNTLLRCLCENAEQLFPGVILDPNKKIPTLEEQNALKPARSAPEPTDPVPDKASIDANLKLVRDELVQSYVWAQARNDALKYVKEQLKAQLREERKIVTTYEEQLRDLEDQDYSIGDTVVLRDSNSRRGSGKPEDPNKPESEEKKSESGEKKSESGVKESGVKESESGVKESGVKKSESGVKESEQKAETEEDMRLYLSTLEQMNNDYENDKTNLYNTIITETFACIEAYTEIRFRQTFTPQQAAAGDA